MTDEQLEKFEKAGIFAGLLVLELVLNFFFAWVLWVVVGELADNQVVNGRLPYWDAFWIALLIRFTVSFSRVLGKARDK